MFKKIDANFTKKNVYFLALVFIALLWFTSLFLDESTAGKLRTAIFNPFWPLILLLTDSILEEKKKENDERNELIVKKLKALLGDRTNTYDRKYLLAVIEGLEEESTAKEAAEYMEKRIEDANPIR